MDTTVPAGLEDKKPLLINKLGSDFVNQFYMLVKTVKIHDIRNEVFVKGLDRLAGTVNQIIEERGAFAIKLVDGSIYMDETRLRAEAINWDNFMSLANELQDNNIGGIAFIEQVAAQDFREAIRVMNTMDSEVAEPADTLNKKLRTEGVKVIQFLNLQTFEEVLIAQKEFRESKRQFAVRTYAKSMLFLRNFFNNLDSPKAIYTLRIGQRIMQDLVTISYEKGVFLLGLTTVKEYENYLVNHSVNVAVISVALGQKLGMEKNLLCELGLAAMFHDIGKTKISSEILDKDGKLNDEEWQEMMKHPLYSVKTLLQFRGFAKTIIPKVVVAFEHHRWYNNKGYPRARWEGLPHLFSRIVSIADGYDALTTAKPYRPAYLPDETLRLMTEQSGTKYDPTLLKVFLNLMGMYPLGTVVLLDTGEIGIVYHTSYDPKKYNRPKIKLMTDPHGNKLPTSIVDLSEIDELKGKYKRSIIKSLRSHPFEKQVPQIVME